MWEISARRHARTHTQKNTHTQTHISHREKETWAVKRLGSIYQTNIWATGSISVARHCYQELQVGNQVDSPRNYVSLYPCQHILGKKRRNENSYINATVSVLMSLTGFHILTKMWYWQPCLLKISWYFYGHISEKFFYVCWLSIFLCAFLSV